MNDFKEAPRSSIEKEVVRAERQFDGKGFANVFNEKVEENVERLTNIEQVGLVEASTKKERS